MPRNKSSLPVESRQNTGAATIRDVARRAGVSVASVSRVMNSSAAVREPTRRRILEAASELRFTPNASARSLSMRQTAVVGVLLPDLHGEFFSELLRGIDRTAQQHEQHLLVSSSHHGSRGIAAALRAMHGRVDGLIVMAPEVAADALAEALPRALPIVLLNCAAGPPADGAGKTGRDNRDNRVQAIAVDNFGGAVAMVRHLAAVGHQRIAFIAGAAHNEDARERRRGYCAAMQELGLSIPPSYQPRGDFAEEGGWRATQELLAETSRPTAIFAANDMMALGALRALRDCGLDVPGDVAVTGFDDIPTARYVSPPLTTVRVDVEALGVRAATVLLDRMATPDNDRQHSRPVVARREIVPSVLVIRGSCTPSCTPSSGPSSLSNPQAMRLGSTSTQLRTSPGNSRRTAATSQEIIS